MVEVSDDLPGVTIRLLHNWLRNGGLCRSRKEGREPFAVDVDTVLDGVVFGEGQRKAVTDNLVKGKRDKSEKSNFNFSLLNLPDLHEPCNLCLVSQCRCGC